jgi:hypothetical protein
MATDATPQSPKSKDLKNKDGQPTKLVEWATMDANSVDEMIELFGTSGVSYSSGEEITGDYTLVTGDEKQLFLQRVQGRRVFCVQWEFRTPAGKATASTREFVSVHVVIDGHGKFIVNDSAKGGFYGQLSEITSKRIETGKSDRESKTGLLAQRGFKPNKPFFFDVRTGKAIPRADMDTVPEEHREQAKPTWKLEF